MQWSENNLEDGGRNKEVREGRRIKKTKSEDGTIHISQGCGKL